VTAPTEILRGTPQYTSDAMRARIQGPILVECVVQTNGICTDIHVIRSFEPAFGLDQEAIKATRQWRFRPGTRKGEPVPVRVTIELMFTIR
jgi:protein TonB